MLVLSCSQKDLSSFFQLSQAYCECVVTPWGERLKINRERREWNLRPTW